MPVSFQIIPIPLGSQYVETISDSEPISLNDFLVRIIADENVELEQSAVSVSSGSSLVAFRGEKSVYEATIRPQQTAGMVTVTIAANAVSQGNAQTSKSIRVSTSFPDADAEVQSHLTDVSGVSQVVGMAVSPTRIIVSSSARLEFYTHAGIVQASERLTGIGTSGKLAYINGDVILRGNRRSLATGDILVDYPFAAQSRSITHTRLGLMEITSSTLRVLPYGSSNVISLDPTSPRFSGAAHQDNLLFTFVESTSGYFGLARITDEDQVEFIKRLNIRQGQSGSSFNVRDIALYGDTLYTLESSYTATGDIYTLDIKKYRPLAKNTKTRIDVQFANAGDTLDLKQFAPDAERFTFAVGFDKPPYLSINSNHELVIGAGGNVAFVKLTAINRIDSIDLEFYLVILQAAAPIWRDVPELTMRAESSYDLFQLVLDAETIAFRSGRPRLAGSSLSNGIFTVGTVGGLASFTAQKGSRSTHIEIQIDVIQASDTSNFSDIFRHRVEIAGIDVTADVKEFPTATKSLDIDTLNEYLVSEVSLTLRSNNQNGFKYNSGISGNFWEINGLNAGGFQAPVKVYVESLVDGNWVSSLLFSGIISEPKASIPNAEITLVGVDISSQFENARVQNFGTLQKWARLRLQSDEGTYENLYVPEASVLPIQPESVSAWTDRTELTLSRLRLPSEGLVPENTAHPTESDLRLPSVYRGEPPVANFKTTHRAEDVRFLIQQLALTSRVYNTEIDIPSVEVETPFVLNHGSIAFSVEKTRTTRLPVDWVHDPSNNRMLNLLSNPEGHVSDMLVQYSLNSDSYRVLHEFDKDLVVHRIARRNSSNYYILTSKPIPQDRSAQHLPRRVDSTGYAYDSAAEGSEIKIWHYNASTNTLTEYVAANNARPPQLGIHYWVGFENPHYIDEFEGITPDDRGTFKWHNNNLYYRYATVNEFGVARVNTSGTTSEMIKTTDLDRWNHLNFAFDINASGTIYFVYATINGRESSLVIKQRTNGGTETTVLTDTKSIGLYSEANPNFGAYLGAHECLFHNNYLYILVPISSLSSSGNAVADIRPSTTITAEDTGMTNVARVRDARHVPSVRPGAVISAKVAFYTTISGISQGELTVTGGEITSFTRVDSNTFDVEIKPFSVSYHRNIILNIPRNAVDQGNEATQILFDFGLEFGKDKAAGAVLYRCDVTASTPTLDVVEKYDYVQLGACNLVVHDGAVHFVENPPAATKFKPINPDLENYWTDADKTQTMGYNLVPESLGALKRINANGTVESLGNLYFEERPYNIAATRCLSFDDDLHVVMGYGNLDEVLRVDSLASQADNFQHLVYGQKLRYVLPSFAPSGSVYEALADIAKKVNATLSIQDNIILVHDRSYYRAMTDGGTGTGTGNLDFDGENKAFPSNGYLLIDKEIIGYTGITGNTFTGITRGVLGTAISSHANNTPVLYLDKVLDKDRVLGNFSELQDTNRIYNLIRDPENNFEERDPFSINTFGERPYTLNLGLTRHETAWQKHVFAEYLAGLKDPHLLMNLTLRPSFYLELGDIVGLRYADLVYAVQIVSITYTQKSTTIRGRVI